MKKTYFKPETLFVKIELQQMVALSMGGTADDQDALTRQDFYEDEDDDYVKSRRTRNVWDDDDRDRDLEDW